MADTFFGFDIDVSRNNGRNLHSPDEPNCVDTEEDEYDALNDETFGAIGDLGESTLDDWEQQHEEFAEFTEHSRQSEQIENSLCQLVLDDSDPEDFIPPPSKDLSDSTWAYKGPTQNGDVFNTTMLASLSKANNNAFADVQNVSKIFNKSPTLPMQIIQHPQQVPKKICTLEELERGLRQQKQIVNGPPPIQQNNNLQHGQPIFQNIPIGAPAHLLPGMVGHLPPMGIPLIHNMPPGMPLPNMPPGFTRMMPPQPQHPAFMHQHAGPPPGLIFPGNNLQFPSNHPYNFPPPSLNGPPPTLHQQMQMRNNHQQLQQGVPNRNHQNRVDMNHTRHKTEMEINRDEYAGLMTNREKQWLLNIQLLQLNTGTPYFDDYYYTVFKERKLKNKENQPGMMDRRDQRYNTRHRNHSDRQENANTLPPRVYTLTQFENSLGKLQCGSVTAPRKIIDMDVVTLEKDTENTPTRDTRKTKQLLLELEALYTLMLKAEDLRNPVAISNSEKLREQKQKQRLRELELAQTAEQKTEVLRILTSESIPQEENQVDYLVKIVSGLLAEDKFTSFLNIRKGKMLLFRVLPHLNSDLFQSNLSELWMKVLLSLAAVGRRDTSGDNLLPRLHPYFKRYIQSSKMSDILDIVSSLVEIVRQENHRSTPLSHQGKSPLHFVVVNKFGVSALITMLVRTEYLISSDNATEKQINDWSNFLLSWAEFGSGRSPPIAPPLELIPRQIFIKHTNRISKLTPDKKLVLEKNYCDLN